MFKKTRGAEAKLAYMGQVVTENRGMVVDVRVTQATGTAERDAALEMLSGKPEARRSTLGADRGYDTAGFVNRLREMNVTPHVAQNNTNRRSAVEARTTRHAGYAISQRTRKRVEEVYYKNFCQAYRQTGSENEAYDAADVQAAFAGLEELLHGQLKCSYISFLGLVMVMQACLSEWGWWSCDITPAARRVHPCQARSETHDCAEFKF
ncbi:MAG: transposase [Bryobacteraceae bacterium]